MLSSQPEPKPKPNGFWRDDVTTQRKIRLPSTGMDRSNCNATKQVVEAWTHHRLSSRHACSLLQQLGPHLRPRHPASRPIGPLVSGSEKIKKSFSRDRDLQQMIRWHVRGRHCIYRKRQGNECILLVTMTLRPTDRDVYVHLLLPSIYAYVEPCHSNTYIHWMVDFIFSAHDRSQRQPENSVTPCVLYLIN